MRCDECGSPATIHITRVRRGRAVDEHLCPQCCEDLHGVIFPNTTGPDGAPVLMQSKRDDWKVALLGGLDDEVR